MRNFTGVVLGETRMQIRSNSRVNMSSRSHIFQHIHIEKFRHCETPTFFSDFLSGFICFADYAVTVFPSGFACLRLPGLPRRKKNPA